MVKKISVYGSYRVKVPVRQRYWKKRSDGVKQRYWVTTKNTKTVTKQGRYEFTGKGKDLYRAIKIAKRRVPKNFVDVSAEEFLKNPELYSDLGQWIESEVESG